MTPKSLLIANRGEIAVRIMRAAAELGIRAVGVYSEDDARSLHVAKADEARPLKGKGALAYLDIEGLVEAAQRSGCDAVHPGYGFLAENAAFAAACADAGLTFVGPEPGTLEAFGDKSRAREIAQHCGVPLLPGTHGPTSLDEARDFLHDLGAGGAIMIKAIAGGGGRGMRPVTSADDLESAYERCQSEAKAAFGNPDVYVEKLIPRARHIEVQIAGDGVNVSHLWERECTIQRRNQKVVEVAPSPSLHPGVRERLTDAAVRLANEVGYTSLGTFEFLVDAESGDEDSTFAFIEVNARLQVEHTVTEEVTGIDLVKTQLRLAAGETLEDMGLCQPNIDEPRGYAIQLRVNMETMNPDGSTVPNGGTLSAFEPPSGPGIRTDTFGYAGYTTSPSFDSLLAKVIAYSPSKNYSDAVARAYRALCEFKIGGVRTNVEFLQNLLRHPDFSTNDIYTRFVEDNIDDLLKPRDGDHRRYYFEEGASPGNGQRRRLAGAKVDARDPLAVLDHGRGGAASSAPRPAEGAEAPAEDYPEAIEGPENTTPVTAPMQGTIVSIDVAEGDLVYRGQQLLVMEAMKMEHVIKSTTSGLVRQFAVEPGDAVFEGHALVFIEESDETEVGVEDETAEMDLEYVRPDLEEVIERHELGFDAARPEAVARRRKTNHRTARENINDICDPDTFVEYGPIAIAAQRRRRELDDLIRNTPADGMIAGVGSVNGAKFGDRASQCVLMSYDYTVLAGTQGQQNHRKKDRMFEIAEHSRLPVIFFTEGGGGRPGDTDGIGVAGLDCWAFNFFGRLSGLVPLVGITTGRCFAGNAALLGCCDVVIATKGSNIGMGGPAMVEGGNLGIFRPEEIGPMDVQVPNGVVDLPVEDEPEAVQVAKQYLSYFQGPLQEWTCEDQRKLRHLIPENRLRIYDVRQVIETLADTGSMLEIRRQFGVGMVTALIRIEGRPVGVIANNPSHLAGAIDSPGADKATRFMQLCDAFDIPILFLCDTPGIMVGPEVEKTALVRHASRMFVTGASLTVPFFTIILRKGYGLGAQAMAGGSFKAPFFTVSWPTGEFGGMGLEGAVKLGYRKELAAIEDPEERAKEFEKRVARMYEHGKAVSTASYFEIDDVIDPMESRHWIMGALKSAPPPLPRAGKKRPCVDTW